MEKQSDSITHLHSRLEQLKAGYTLYDNIESQTLYSRLFSLLTSRFVRGVSLLCLMVFMIQLGVSSYSSYTTITSQFSSWKQILSTIHELSPKSRSTQIDSLRSDLKSAIPKETRYLGINILLEKDIDDTLTLLDQWLLYASPLLNYQLSPQGFVFVGPGNNVFTNDLNTFLINAQSLLPKTKKLIDSFWYYKIIGYLTLNPTIISYLNSLDSFYKTAQTLIQNKDDILSLLGHETRRTYMIFTQNTSESRPTGGFTSAFIPVSITKGLIEISESTSIFKLLERERKQTITHPVISHGLHTVEQGVAGGIQNVNYFTCYSTVARLYQNRLAQLDDTPIPTNGIIMISTVLFHSLLPDDTILTVEGYRPMNKSNILTEIDRISTPALEAKPENLDNLKSPLGLIFKVFLEKLPSIIDSFGIVGFASKILDALYAKDLLVWVENQFVQGFLDKAMMSGNKTCSRDNVISPLHINLTGDKRDGITTNQYALSAKPVFGGYRVSVNYKQILPESKNLPRGFTENLARHFFGLQIPSQSWNIEVSSPTMYTSSPVQDYYFLNVQQNGRDYYIPDEFKILYDSLSSLPNGGYSYLQPDGTKIVGSLLWTDNKTTEATISFNIPYSYLSSLEFIGQAGVNKPEISLGSGLWHKSNHDKRITDRITIQKGVQLLLV